jgi:hypothetical protein
METTTTKAAKPYDGKAATAAVIAIAKRSEHVRYLTADERMYGRRAGVTVGVAGRGHFRPADYGSDNSVYPRHAVAVVNIGTHYSNHHPADDFDAKIEAFAAELEAAGFDVIRHVPHSWLVAGPGWADYMRKIEAEALATRVAAEDARVTAAREAIEIRALLEAHGVTHKYVDGEHSGSARVTLYLADIKTLLGLT